MYAMFTHKKTVSIAELADISASADEINLLDGALVTTAEINYISGVTSAIQTQLNNKAASVHTHLLAAGATDVTATAAEINTACDGSTAKNAHTHVLTSGATDVTATYAEINTACDGDTAKNSHTHPYLSSELTGPIVNALAQDLYTNDYLGWASTIGSNGTPQFRNSVLDTFQADSMTASNMSYSSGYYFYFGPTGVDSANFSTIDEFSDSSLDLTIWTKTETKSNANQNAVVSETASDLSLYVYVIADGSSPYEATAKATLGGSLSKKLSNYSYYCKIGVTSIAWAPYASATMDASIVVTDGSSSQVIFSKTAADASPHTVEFLVVGNYLCYRTDSGAFSVADISAWTKANIVFYMSMNATTLNTNPSTATFLIGWARYYAFSSPPTCTLTSGATSASAAINQAITTCNYIIALPVISMSADGGSNYETETLERIHAFTATGTSFKTKFTWSGYTEPFLLSEYFSIFNN